MELLREIHSPAPCHPLLALLLSVSGAHHDTSAALEASQGPLLEGALGREEGFAHLASFPANFYSLEVMLTGIPCEQ